MRGLTRKRMYIAAAVLAVAGGAIWAIASRDRAVAGPRTTAANLRRQLDRTGLTITYRTGRTGDGVVAVVAGVVHVHGGRFGFEFDLTKGRPPTDADVGRAGFPVSWYDNGAVRSPVQPPPRYADPNIRGVLGNVAYANYFYGGDYPRGPLAVARNKIDDALFASFPPDDAEAHAIVSKP